MRFTRVFQSPCRSGKGFLFRGVAIAAIVVGAVTPARAANTSVTLSLGAGHYAPTGAACSLSVPAGANGIAVLDAAVAKGCIVSYHLTSFGNGHFIDCIDGVCGDQTTGAFLTYWSMYWDGTAAAAAIDSFRAGAQHDLGLSYVTWVTCIEPNPACDQF